LKIYLSQGSAATEFRGGGRFLFYRIPQFICESKGERIIEIGPYLPKLSTKV